jgi:hypothetical protein
MPRSHYKLTPSGTVIEAARTAVAEELRRHLPVVRESPPEIRELIAQLVALDTVRQRAAKHRAIASLGLQLPLPGATPRRG